MRAMICLAVFICFQALLSFFFDSLFGQAHLVLSLGFSLLLTLWCLRKMIASSKEASFKGLLFGSVFFVLLYLYFLLAARPHFLPLCPFWDGANHLAIMEHLARFDTHAGLKNLSWEGYLTNYPWGTHALIVGFSRLAAADPIFFIHPALSAVSSAIVLLVFYEAGKEGVSYWGMAVAGAVLLLMNHTFGFLFGYNCWSQIFGTFVVSAAITYFKRSSGPKDVAVPVIFLAGSVLIYPLFSVLLFTGYVFYRTAKFPQETARTLFVVAVSLMLSVKLYVWDNFHVAGFTAHKPGAEYFNFSFHSDFPWFLFVLSVCVFVAAFRMVKHKVYENIFCLLAPCLSVVFWLLGFSRYWTEKYLLLSSFLFLPTLVSIILFFEKKVAGKWKVIGCAAILTWLVINTSFLCPIYRFRPAISINEYELRKWCEKNIPDKPVYYVAKGFRKSWLEAITRVPAMRFPENWRQATIDQEKDYRPYRQLADFLRISKPGDRLIVNGRAISLYADKFKLIRQQGNYILVERTK